MQIGIYVLYKVHIRKTNKTKNSQNASSIEVASGVVRKESGIHSNLKDNIIKRIMI